MAESQQSIFSFPKLNATNYSIWKVRTECRLTKEGLWEYTIAPPQNPSEEEGRLIAKARALLLLSLEDSILPLVYKENSAKQIWTVFQQNFEKQTAGEKLFLTRKLC